MNTKDAIKYLAIAVGAYLLYQWLSKNGYLAQLGIGTSTAAGTAATGTSTPAAQITGTSAGSVPTTSTSSVSTVPVAAGGGAPLTAQQALAALRAANPNTDASIQSDGTVIYTASDSFATSTFVYNPATGATTQVNRVPHTVATVPTPTTPARTQIATIPSASGDGSYIPVYSDGTMGAPVFPGASGGGTPAPASPSQSTVALVAAMSQGDAYLNGGGTNGSGPFDHWNYYYNQTAEGKANPGPNDSDVGVDPNANITLQQWWNLVSAHGVSGLRGLSGYAPGFTQWGIG